jgi:hypothetical protein
VGAQGSNLEKTQGQSLPGLPIPPPPIKSPRPESNRLPASYKLAALPSELQGRSVPGAIRTRTTDLLGIVTPAVGLRGRGASAPSRTGCLRLTGSALWPGELQRLSWGTWARTRNLLGQDQARCQIAPFPIEYAGRDLNPQTARFELASFAELALPAPACAARDLNPDRDTG